MGLKGLACIAAVAIAATAVVPTAEAQTRKQQAAPSSQNTVFITRDENGRTATRVIVTPRSYLDGGTEGPARPTQVQPPGHGAILVADRHPRPRQDLRAPAPPTRLEFRRHALLLLIELGGRNATRRAGRAGRAVWASISSGVTA